MTRTRATSMPLARQRISDESGVAILVAVIVMFIVIGMIAIISMAAINSQESAQNQTDRVLGTAPVDQGVQTYTALLNAWEVGEHQGYVMTQAAMQRMANGPDAPPGAAVIPNSSLPAGLNTVDTSATSGVPAVGRYTFRYQLDGGGGAYGFWQVYSFVPPRYNDAASIPPRGRVVVYFRGWAGDQAGVATSSPEFVRAELRPGRFADYQVLADGPVLFADGATINGKVHSNGFPTSRFQIWNSNEFVQRVNGNVNCQGRAEITTSKGDVGAGICTSGSARIRTNTKRSLTMLGAEETVDVYRDLCTGGQSGINGGARVVCWAGAPIQGVAPYTSFSYYNVTLGNGQITVQDGAGSSTVSALPGAVVVFPNHVFVRGTLSGGGRATIVAHNPNGTLSSQGAASVYIAGNTSRTMNDPRTSVGLIAQGDVIPYINPHISPANSFGAIDCVSNTGTAVTLNAAMMALSGGLWLQHEYRSPVNPGGTLPSCASLSMTGSVVGHYRLGTTIAWNASPPYPAGTTGFRSRSYLWDENLYNNPPPLYPTTGPWDIADYKSANYDCFNAAGALADSSGDCA